MLGRTIPDVTLKTRVRDMGADYTVNYRERPDWAAARAWLKDRLGD